MKIIFKPLMMIVFMCMTVSVDAADSYRYLHVTIDTPWMIFIFLLIIIMVPFVLMAVLYWYFAFKKSDTKPVVESIQSEKSTIE